MDVRDKKCSSKEHKEIKAISYCCNCGVFMCNKCENFHSNLLQNHNVFNIDYYLQENFTGFCKEDNHNNKLEYYCKTHNILCCVICIAKIKNKNHGKHSDCVICNINDDIINEKKNIMIDNINYLEKISTNIQNSINEIKNLFEKVTETKENLKKQIQNIFTKIRNELNTREGQLLSEVDTIYNKSNLNDNLLRDYEKLPKRINTSLEKAKLVQNENNKDKNIILINECIQIENSIKDFNKINEGINELKNSNNITFNFSPNEIEMKEELERIKSFGKIIKINYGFMNSNIIKNDVKGQNSIVNWIKEKIRKNDIQLKLIFKMTEHGTNGKSFHNYCDNKGPTLTLIKTNKNKIFGGFTPLNWENDGKTKFDKSNQTFIFSLNLNKKFDMISTNKRAIQGFEIDYGPNFGDYDFGLATNLKEGQTYANSSCNYLSNKKLELTGNIGNNENFQTEEVEVYQVIF